MSAFDNYEKSEIVESIERFVKSIKEQNPHIQINDITEEVLEAVNRGLKSAIWGIENKE